VRYLVTGREKLGMSNFDAGYIDPRDGRSVSDGIIHAGTLHLDGSLDENLKISYVAPIIGGREGRLIKGEDTLRFKDFIRGDYTDEPVFYEYSNHDTHSRDWAFESEIIQKWLTVANMWGQNFTVPVSAGTMLPKGFSGILAVGRCLSADHDAAQSVRMQMAMQKSGQAAVILCAASTVLDKTLKNVPYNFIKDELESAGLLNGKDNDIPFRLIDDAGELKEKLASKDPGTGIWAAYVKYEKFSNFLREWVVSGDECLARSSALALGLAGDTRALPLLRKIVRERDMFMPETGRELRTPRICSAIYLLAEMNDFDCIETLLDIMNESDDFFVISNAFSGLLKMLERNPEIRKEKAERMEKIMLGKDFQPLLNMKVNITTEDMTYYMRIKAGKAFDRWGIPHSLFRSLKDNLSTRDRILMKFEPENY
jgi:hypothetical protein